MSIFEEVRDRLPRIICRDGCVVRVLATPGPDVLGVAGEIVPCSAVTLERLQGVAGRDPRADGTYSVADIEPLVKALITETNEILISDAPYSSQQKAAWRAWRASIRGLLDDPRGPAGVTWPVPPDA